jgi:hypothetical protein
MGSPSASTGGGGERRYEPPKKKNKVVEFIKGGGILGAAIRGVKKSAEKSKMQKELDYEGSAYQTKSSASYQPVSGNDGGATGSSGQVVQAPTVTAPTTAEVSQSTATDAEDPILLRKRKVKAKGRSPTIMTGVTGATGSLTLGKPSLLGR